METMQQAPAPGPTQQGGAVPVAKKTRLAQVPSAGRIVHYVAANGIDHWPAMVVKVTTPGDPDSTLTLRVFAGNADTYVAGIPHRPTGLFTKTWHWPEPVPPVEVEVIE